MASIYIYDSNQWGWTVYPYDEKFQVNSVAETVEAVLSVTKNQRYRSYLTIGGGGGLNYQSVGAGANTDSTGFRSLQLNADGGLLGSAAYLLPKLSGQLSELHLNGINEDNSASFSLMLAVAKILGIGSSIYGQNTLLKYYGDRSEPVRRPTHSATVDRGALRKRLSEYTAK